MYLAELDLPEANAMRAQCEAPGMMALEIAIDEFAEKLGLDPIEFRIINHTQTVPDNPARPQSSKDPQAKIRKSTRVRPCRSRSASWSNAYGSARNASAGARPAQVREGRWLIGLGVAAAFRDNLVMKSAARVRLDNRGVVTVETDMTDIGTGSYTVIAQTVAEMMGVPLKRGGKARRLDVPRFLRIWWGGKSASAGVYAASRPLPLRRRPLRRRLVSSGISLSRS